MSGDRRLLGSWTSARREEPRGVEGKGNRWKTCENTIKESISSEIKLWNALKRCGLQDSKLQESEVLEASLGFLRLLSQRPRFLHGHKKNAEPLGIEYAA